MMLALSDGNATLAFKNDMAGVSAEDIASDMSKIKDNVRALIEASGDYRYDLILDGGENHAWITELSSIAEDGSFEAFIERALNNSVSFSDMTVEYESDNKSFNVKYNEHFKLNGEKIDTNYARYESAYVDGKVEREAEVISLSFGGKTLTLNFKEGTREEQ